MCLPREGGRSIAALKHIVSCSFGKDSLATILLALEHGEPLDEAVYCEVMFDKPFQVRCRNTETLSTIPPFPNWSRWVWKCVSYARRRPM